MNSGKSTVLLQVAHNYEEQGMNVMVIKAKIDDKGNDKIISRLGLERQVDLWASEKIDLYNSTLTTNSKSGVDCVLIDEAQFLSPEQVNQLFKLAVVDNIPIICYGIRTDFTGKLFPGSNSLFAFAHSLEELKTICRCGKKALMNARKLNGKFVFTGNQVAIDGKDKVSYESLCGKCYLEEKDINN